MDIAIGIVQINVTDLDEAWRFYVETLGLPGKRTLGIGKAFELDLGLGGPRVLIYPAPGRALRTYPTDTGVTLVFYTPRLRQTISEWTAKGVNFIPIEWSRDESGIAASPFGSFIAFTDPSGNVHELLEPTQRQGTQRS